jgi:hypothetical protein
MPVDYRIIVARRNIRYNDYGSVDKGSTGIFKNSTKIGD